MLLCFVLFFVGLVWFGLFCVVLFCVFCFLFCLGGFGGGLTSLVLAWRLSAAGKEHPSLSANFYLRTHLLLSILLLLRWGKAGELLPVCQELLPLHTSLYMHLGTL